MTSKNSKIRVLLSDSHNPWFNLATEDWIFRELSPEQRVLFLWRNTETVVIGRFQNPWVECNTKKMEEDGVYLARRQSGGGTVFQDLGNTNFTFMSSRENFSKEANNKIITNAINSFGLNSYASGRNDIVVEDSEGAKKISGSAFKEKKDRSFHHGTLLINANLQKLTDYLNPTPKKLEAKGITSVRSRVTNLSLLNSAITHDSLTRKIIELFFETYEEECPIETLRQEDLKEIPSLKKYFDFLSDKTWRYGETPHFSHHLQERFEWGGLDVHLNVKKGVVEKATIFSDSLHPELIEELMNLCQGMEYSEKGASHLREKALESFSFLDREVNEFCSWLASEFR